MGTSLFTQRPVAEDLIARLPATLELALYAMALAVLIGVPLGVVAALRRNSWFDHLCSAHHRRRPGDGGVLAGDPAAVAVFDVARPDPACRAASMAGVPIRSPAFSPLTPCCEAIGARWFRRSVIWRCRH